MSDEQQTDISQATTEEKSAEQTLYGSDADKADEQSEQIEEPKGEEKEPEGESEEKAEEGKQEEFNLQKPEETLLTDSQIDEIVSIAKEQGLSKDQAQKFLDMQSEAVSSFQETLQADYNNQVKQWGEEIKADKELGGENLTQSVELAKRAVTAFGSEEFLAELDESGYGNHPKLFRMLTRIGRELEARDLVISNAQSNEPKSFAEAFYPSQDKQ